MHRPLLRRPTTLALAGAVALAVACSYDEAELVRPGTAQVQAELGQLRVLSYEDDPSDDWIDVVAADPAVYEEGDQFREDDSRTADPNEPAERRRLFTAVGSGRTLLVELNCVGCEDGVPATSVRDTGLHVWDLLAGDPDRRFSSGTEIAEPGVPVMLAPGDHAVVVRPGAQGRGRVEVASDAPAIPVRLVADHTPEDGADLFVDVYVAVSAGDATISYRNGVPSTYVLSVR